jgi:hypothetical protein
MRTNHIQTHIHNQNSNTTLAELREEFFGDLDIFDLGNLVMLSMMISTILSLAIYAVAVYVL